MRASLAVLPTALVHRSIPMFRMALPGALGAVPHTPGTCLAQGAEDAPAFRNRRQPPRSNSLLTHTPEGPSDEAQRNSRDVEGSAIALASECGGGSKSIFGSDELRLRRFSLKIES